QDDAADGGDDHVVSGRHAAAVALELATEARTERDRAGQSDEAADRVNDRRTREVVERNRLDRVEPAVGDPGPVPEDLEVEAADAEAIEEVAHEAGATDHRARGDRAAGVGEGELEEPEREERDAGRAVGVRGAVQEEELVPDEAVAR